VLFPFEFMIYTVLYSKALGNKKIKNLKSTEFFS
jgi:hypothetical protein